MRKSLISLADDFHKNCSQDVSCDISDEVSFLKRIADVNFQLEQWFSKWSIATPRGQLNHPRGRKEPRCRMGVNE